MMTDYYEHKLDPVGVRPAWLGDEFWFDNDTQEWLDWSEGRYGWHKYITAIRIPADHWAVPFLRRGETPVRPPETPARDPALVERFIEFARQEALAGDLTAQDLMAELEPEPVDPLVEALEASFLIDNANELDAAAIRSELAKRGGRIVFD